jgi:GNAT superfamily N-acetyltransferase
MYSIRAAAIDDRDAIFPLARDMATSYPVSENGFASSFASILSSQMMCLGVATHSNTIVGYVLGGFHPCFYASGPIAWVEEIMVKPEFRKKGIGRLLMGYFEEWAITADCRLVSLATRRAADFYLALNYKESAAYFKKEIGKYPPEDKRTIYAFRTTF